MQCGSATRVPIIYRGVLHLDGANIKKIEKRMKEDAGRVGRDQGAMDAEVPSFVDDICMDVVDWEGGLNMQAVEGNVKELSGRWRRNADFRWRPIKSKSCICDRAGRGRTQTGNTSSGWGSFSTTLWTSTSIGNEGMIRSIATWGAELGWRGQKAWEKNFGQLQYQEIGRQRVREN